MRGDPTKMSREEIKQNLALAFESFEGYVGINNHMGSKLTQNAEIMQWVMEELKPRDLIFVDSKTIPTSVAWEKAALSGLRYAERDVFLDHEETLEFSLKALKSIEYIALHKGQFVPR